MQNTRKLSDDLSYEEMQESIVERIQIERLDVNSYKEILLLTRIQKKEKLAYYRGNMFASLFIT